MSTFYPALNSIVDEDFLPEQLAFLNSSLSTILGKIYYKDYEFSISNDKSQGFFDLKLITKENIEMNIIGSDVVLVLNQGSSSDTIIPIVINYRWPILTFLSGFKPQNFSEAIADLKTVVFELVSSIDEVSILVRLIEAFEELPIYEYDNGIDKYQSFVDFIDKVNTAYSLSSPDDIPYPTQNLDVDEMGSELLNNLKSNTSLSQSLFEVISTLYLSDSDITVVKQNLDDICATFSGLDVKKIIANIIVPQISASLFLSVGLKISRKLLIPLDAPVNEGGVPLSDTEHAIFNFAQGQLTFSTREGIGFEEEVAVTLNHPCQIGQTGIGISFDKVKLDLSRNSNLTEADLDGRPKDFIGCFIDNAAISLPSKWFKANSETTSSINIVGFNLLIGTGGISGTLGLEFSGSESILWMDLGESENAFKIGFESFGMTFRQNVIQDSNIRGFLKIPGFKIQEEDETYSEAIIPINASLNNNGDFKISASRLEDFLTITIPDVLRVKIMGLELGKKDNKFYVAVSGALDIIASMEGIDTDMPKNIDVNSLVIWEDGKIEIPKDILKLPRAFKLKVGPVALSVTDIGFGSYQQNHKESGGEEYLRQYKFFGFSGSLNTGPGGVSVSGDGVKFYYTTDNNDDENAGPIKSPHRFLRIEGIGIDIKIPGTAKTPEEAQFLLKGYLAMRNAPTPSPAPENANPNPQREYLGNVDFAINKIKLYGSAAMRINPDVPAFLVDVNVDLPQGIPLGTTGLAIKGFRGLVGQRYLPDKAETKEWWQYYKDPDLGIGFKKFKQQEGFSLGAGVALETQPDKGKAMSAKVFFLLGLPDVFLLQGQAGFLEGSQKLSDPNDPPFQALIAIDNRSLKATLGVKYLIPNEAPEEGEDDPSGKIADINGKAEMAFFFNNASGWYVNIGRDLPESERIKARILDLFDAYAFIMFSKKGIYLGAGAKFEFKRSFVKIVEVAAGAYLDIRGRISFKPAQIGGSIALGGYAYASVLKFKLGLSLEATLAAEVRKPFIVTGKMGVSLDLPKPLKNKSFDIEFTWVRTSDKHTDPLSAVVLSESGSIPAKAVNMLTEENFPLNYCQTGFSSTEDTMDIPVPTDSAWSGDFTDYTIPLDSFIDVTFDRSVEGSSVYNASNGSVSIYGNIEGTDSIELVPPQRGILDQVKHDLEIINVKINYWNGSTWAPYFPYDSISSMHDVPEVETALQGNADFLKELPVAYWQAVDPGKKSNLRIMGRNMFSYLSKFLPGSHKLESLGYGDNIVTCEQAGIREFSINWEAIAADTNYQKDTRVQYQNVYITPRGKNAIVKERSNDFGKNHGLELSFPDGMEVLFPDAVTKVRPKVSSDNNDVVFTWFKRVVVATDENYRPVYSYSKVVEHVVEANNLSDYEGYNDEENPIDKLLISVITGPPESALDDDLRFGVNWWVDAASGSPQWKIIGGDSYQLDDFMLFEKALTSAEISAWKTNNHLPGNPVAHYKFDNDLTDSGIYEFDGSSTQTMAYTKDRLNQVKKSLLLHQSYVGVAHDDRLSQDVGNFSIGFWFKTPSQLSQKTTLFFPIFSKMGFSYTSMDAYFNQLWISAEQSYTNDYNFYLCYSRYTEVENMTLLQWQNCPLADNAWHHVVLVGDRYNKKLSFYFDGNLAETTDINLLTQAPVTDVCQAFVHEITYLDAASHRFNLKIPGQTQLDEENQKMADALTKTVQPVWRPNTKYAIQISFKDKVDGNEHYQHYHFGFQTRGPVGHFHQSQDAFAQLKEENRQDEYKLANLQHYINFDRSTPPANGDLQRAKPVYYVEPSLRLFYNRPFVYSFYNDWSSMTGLDAITSELRLTVKDATDDLEANALEGTWVQRNGQTTKTEDESLLLRLAANGLNCSGLPTELTKINYMSEYVLPDLEPGKLYSAIYTANYKIGSADAVSEQVHNHVFSTSRYADFEEHINSFTIYDDNEIVKKALFLTSAEFSSTQINAAKAVFNNNGGTDATLIKEYTEIFDRIIYGALQIQQLDAPIGTEVTGIYDETSDELIGLLLRSPEPFIDPRANPSDLTTNLKPLSFSITLNGNTVDSDYALIFSKDKTSVFISNADFDIPEGDADMEFKNILFNGDAYDQDGDAVLLTFSLPIE